MKQFIKKHWSAIILASSFVIGLSLLLYPTVANWWNSREARKLINSYDTIVEEIKTEDSDRMLDEAELYNELLLQEPNRYFPSPELHDRYENTLNIDKNGMMGMISIPSLHLNMPIYHGTSDAVLASNIGHIEGTSLPAGQKTNHTVLSGHRGLPSAKLFTDIDRMVEGDVFLLKVLGKTFTYEVDQIRIVLPEEMDSLEIEPGKDYVTLVTCTPYGINTHRLLVRGKRIANLPDEYLNTGQDAVVINRNITAVVFSFIILTLILIWYLLRYR